MDVLIAFFALILLIAAACRGFSVMIFAPIAAMLAVLLTDPQAVPTVFSGLFMDSGVSLFVVVFVAYPFAAELFRKADIPKRLIPATIVLGAFTFTMDALPGTPQIQNIIPTA